VFETETAWRVEAASKQPGSVRDTAVGVCKGDEQSRFHGSVHQWERQFCLCLLLSSEGCGLVDFWYLFSLFWADGTVYLTTKRVLWTFVSHLIEN
jgi:hypothetical protein